MLVGRQGGKRRLPFEGVEPAGHRRYRPPALADIAIRGPYRIVQRPHRAQGPRPRPAAVAVLGALDFRHQHRHALRRRRGKRRQYLARARKFRGVDGGARNRERALDMTGRLGGQRLDANQPLPRGIPSLTCA